MGVYHLMGLGRSLGTVIGPLTYLAHRYQRWNADDRCFFARSDGTPCLGRGTSLVSLCCSLDTKKGWRHDPPGKSA